MKLTCLLYISSNTIFDFTLIMSHNRGTPKSVRELSYIYMLTGSVKVIIVNGKYNVYTRVFLECCVFWFIVHD